MTAAVEHDVALQDRLRESVDARVGVTLTGHLEAMGTGSLFNLQTALDAMNARGPAGDLILRIPRRPDDRIEVIWRSKQDD